MQKIFRMTLILFLIWILWYHKIRVIQKTLKNLMLKKIGYKKILHEKIFTLYSNVFN